jgi:hypothetical protein
MEIQGLFWSRHAAVSELDFLRGTSSETEAQSEWINERQLSQNGSMKDNLSVTLPYQTSKSLASSTPQKGLHEQLQIHGIQGKTLNQRLPKISNAKLRSILCQSWNTNPDRDRIVKIFLNQLATMRPQDARSLLCQPEESVRLKRTLPKNRKLRTAFGFRFTHTNQLQGNELPLDQCHHFLALTSESEFSSVKNTTQMIRLQFASVWTQVQNALLAGSHIS